MTPAKAQNEDSPAENVDESVMRRAIAGAAVGNALEWFDFGVYGYFAVAIGEVFFPTHSTTASLLRSFAVFAVAFVARPFGSLVFGPLGDRIGRTRIMIMTIFLMSGATTLVGVLPTYQMAGIWAPIGLVILRLIQGFSTGGEYGSAATFIVESAADDRRGVLASCLEIGTMTGYSLAAILALVLNALLPLDAMHTWGWRIPFLCALPLGALGAWLRVRLEDSPAFKEAQAAGEADERPLRDVFQYHWRSMLLCLGLVIMLNVAYYTVLKYMPSYLTSRLGISELHSLLMSLCVLVGIGVLIPCLGRLSDKVGRRAVIFGASGGFILLSLPAFYLMSLGNLWLGFLGLAIIALFVAFVGGVMPSTLPAIFRTPVRNGGFSISYNVSTAAFGGTAPFIITWLISITNNDYIPAFYLMGAGAVALIPAFLIRESAGAPLPGSKFMWGHRSRTLRRPGDRTT